MGPVPWPNVAKERAVAPVRNNYVAYAYSIVSNSNAKLSEMTVAFKLLCTYLPVGEHQLFPVVTLSFREETAFTSSQGAQ